MGCGLKSLTLSSRLTGQETAGQGDSGHWEGAGLAEWKERRAGAASGWLVKNRESWLGTLPEDWLLGCQAQAASPGGERAVSPQTALRVPQPRLQRGEVILALAPTRGQYCSSPWGQAEHLRLSPTPQDTGTILTVPQGIWEGKQEERF